MQIRALGPARYFSINTLIHRIELVHLSNDKVYQQLSEAEAFQHLRIVKEEVKAWLDEYEKVIGSMAHEYITNHMSENASSPLFGQFYIMYKIHKGMKNNKWPTLPVCSDVTSLLHGLLPLQNKQDSYFKDSLALNVKDLLDGFPLHSSHPRGVFTGLILGQILHICFWWRGGEGLSK